MMQSKLIRITTVPISLEKLLEGQLRFMNRHYQLIAISSNAEKMREIAQAEGVQTYAVELTRKITPLKDLIAVYKLYKILKKEQPLFVHTHTPKAGIVGMMAAFFAAVPHRLHTVAGLPLLTTSGVKRRLLTLIEKLTYRFATKVYPNSYALSGIINQLKLTRQNKLKVIANGSSNGIDTDFFNPDRYSVNTINDLKRQLAIKPDDFIFVFIGRIVTDKGINELVAAFDRLSQKQDKVKLLLVGSEERDLDPITESSQTIIKNNAAIIAAGYQADVRPYLAISKALVFPSYREGFPNVVMQAGAMKLPAIVTDINGCNEIIEEGINGVIVPPKDTAAVYAKMQVFLAMSEQKRLEMGKASRDKMIQRYKREMVWESLLEEYQRLASDVEE